MKTPFLFLILIPILFLSLSNAPDPRKENPKPLILHQIVIDSVLFSEFTYTAQNKISEEKSKCQYIKFNYNEKDQLVSKITYLDASAASSDSKVLEALKNRKEWITPATIGPFIREFQETYEYEFDTKINPYQFFGNIPDLSGKYTNTNNVLKDTYTLTGYPTGLSVPENSYEYNDEGYPVSLNNHSRFIYK